MRIYNPGSPCDIGFRLGAILRIVRVRVQICIEVRYYEDVCGMVVAYQAALGKPPPELRGELQTRPPLGVPIKLKLRLNLVK
jgi:hypothetical protein